ncbi:cysteine desulfurase [Aliarcobacter cryaerophilus]|uniref:cysteine desulfurase n=1 Tax=Aliarcobacter cryaerophilus TaxID=28198 RepID=UPI0021B5BD68|nr:cysteine desulfurase [Aliarcobacter cryaerophilus]MCT7510351.1 cysteine desulfurase [Aliarcobacter cryaerophilus]
MYKLNFLQYKNMENLHIKDSLSLNILSNNEDYTSLEDSFKKEFAFESLNYFSFCKSGFLSLLLQLNKKGKIAVSLGETQSLIDACEIFCSLGFDILYLDLNKDGSVNLDKLKDQKIDFLFLSSYTVDTFYKNNLENVKKLTDAKIISNASASFYKNSDVIYFDSYKLTGFSTKSIILFNQNLFEEQAIFEKDGISLNNIFQSLKNQKFENSMKEIFKEKLENSLKDNLYYFIDNKNSLEYTLHFALKGIKARELIRTLALDEILISNGEGCSLGLSKPSRVIQAMGYDELTSRNAITLSFEKSYSISEIDKIVNLISKRYLQIKVLNKG